LKIYNSMGENVISKLLTSNSEVLNIEELTPGIYLLNFSESSQLFIKK